jgi:hypothetical protein
MKQAASGPALGMAKACVLVVGLRPRRPAEAEVRSMTGLPLFRAAWSGLDLECPGKSGALNAFSWSHVNCSASFFAL